MLRIAACALVLALGQTAAAQAPRYPRLQPPLPTVELSDKIKPMVASAAPTATPKPTVAITTLLDTQFTIGVTRPEQEQILAQLIQNTPDSDVEEKSDYYFRLAMFYSQQMRFWTTKASELQGQQAKTASDQAKTNLLKAVKAYKGLTDNDAFRNYPKLDIALFQYGFTLQTGKYMKEARAVYDKLLKNFPNSQYVPYAHLVFGEYYFESGQLADAEARYKQVLKFPKSTAYWYAMYKLGWVHLSLQRNQDALETFFQVVTGTRRDAKQKFLFDAAKHDFIYAYAQIGKIDKAYDVFARVDKDSAADLVAGLAEYALASGQFDKAASAVRTLIAKSPTDSRACQWQYQVARATLSSQLASVDDKVHEIELLAKQHVTQRTTAAETGAGEDVDCRNNALIMAGQLALAYHAEWSRTYNLDTLRYAERLYAAAIEAEPGRRDMQTELAEALWSHAVVEPDAKRRPAAWERAAIAFGAVDSEPMRHAAALAWLNALDFAAPTDGKLAIGRAPSRAPREQPIEGRDGRMVAALTSFLAGYTPQPAGDAKVANADAEVAQARLLLAITLRKYKHYDEATDVLDVFLAQHLTHPSAELAANMLLDSLVQLKSPDLAAVVSGMIADTTFVTGKNQLLGNLTRLRRR